MRVRLVYEMVVDTKDKEVALAMAVENLLDALYTDNMAEIAAAFKEVRFIRKYDKKQAEQ